MGSSWGQSWVHLGSTKGRSGASLWSIRGQCRPTSTTTGEVWPNLGQIWRKLPDVGQTLATLGHMLEDVGQRLSGLAKTWPTSRSGFVPWLMRGPSEVDPASIQRGGARCSRRLCDRTELASERLQRVNAPHPSPVENHSRTPHMNTCTHDGHGLRLTLSTSSCCCAYPTCPNLLP